MPGALVDVRDLDKSFDRIEALRAVAFSIHEGEVLGLVGPNGAGKTTLLECVAGMLPADRSTVLYRGEPLGPDERKSRFFYLPDNVIPWPAQPVWWALDFISGYLGGRAADRASVVDALALAPIIGQRIGTLSKGQRRRVTLALGLLSPQPVLIADEPFEGLDLRQSRDAAQLLREHARAGRTLLLSIHQMADAARACDRFVLISGGRVRGEGTAEELAALASARAGVIVPPVLEEVVLALT